MIIDGVEFRKYDDNYYVSASGDVYSLYSHKILKHNIDCDGYHRVDIHKKHMKIHKLVYITWIGPIPESKQVNHIDDNKDNNHYTNLYAGTQKENIADCTRNNHRIGNGMLLTIRDKQTGDTLTFQPAKLFFDYCGRRNANGNIDRVIKRNWFKKDYELIDIRKGVTTIERN